MTTPQGYIETSSIGHRSIIKWHRRMMQLIGFYQMQMSASQTCGRWILLHGVDMLDDEFGMASTVTPRPQTPSSGVADGPNVVNWPPR